MDWLISLDFFDPFAFVQADRSHGLLRSSLILYEGHVLLLVPHRIGLELSDQLWTLCDSTAAFVIAKLFHVLNLAQK
jgi:hypothetical protein